MAFRGIFPAPDIEPTEFGLFAVAKPSAPTDEKNEDEWTRGFSQEYDTQPSYVRVWDETSSSSYVVSDKHTAPLYREIKPIFIEVEDFHSTFGLVGDDRFKRATTQLEAVSQKALEAEFCDGKIARSSGLANTYLAKSTASVDPAISVDRCPPATRPVSNTPWVDSSDEPPTKPDQIKVPVDEYFRT